MLSLVVNSPQMHAALLSITITPWLWLIVPEMGKLHEPFHPWVMVVLRILVWLQELVAWLFELLRWLQPYVVCKKWWLDFFFLHLVWLIISCFWEFSYVPNVSLGTAATHILPCVQPSFQPIFRRAILFCLCVVIHSYRYAAQSGKAARHSGGFLFFGRYIRITFIVR